MKTITLCFSKKMTLAWLLLLSPLAMAVNGSNRLEQMDFSTLPGNRVQVQLTFAELAQNPISFSTDNPARIVLDFPNTALGLRKKSQPIGVGVVQGASAVETEDRSRVVVNLVRMVPFNIEVMGKRILVALDNQGSQTLVSSPDKASDLTESNLTTQAVSPRPKAPVKSMEPQIQNIEFRRTNEGAGRVEITLSDPTIEVDIQQEGENVVVKFTNAQLSSRLDRRLDVVDFSTPISFIDTFPVGADVRMNITISNKAEYHAYQTDNIYVVEVNEKIELPKEEETKIEERTYEGQLVSFNFQNIDVRAALSLLFDLPGVNFNMVAGDNVGGNITLRLKNIPWDQALDIILEARGLGMRKVGNVVMVDLKENIDKRKQTELESQKKIKELEPLRTEFITINYAKADDLEKLLKTAGQHSFLSDRGNVSVDKRTNTLIIQDTIAKIAEIRQLITSLDTPVRQVLIESRIVIASSDFSRDLGVKFGYSANEALGHSNGVVFGGKTPGDTTFSGNTGFNSGNTETRGPENYIVSLPALGSSGTPASVGLAIGKIGSYLLQLELSAMQNENKGEVVSNPRVITGNQQEAVITQGTEIGYVPQVTGIGAPAQAQFKQATLELKVTPQITPDDRINLDLAVKKDSQLGSLLGIPSIATRSVKTNVLVDNGETIILGGVYEKDASNTLTRVPFLSDLPLVGNLFKSRSNQEKQSELLIFITPKILKETT
ncbi:bacterial type II and III secretion system protein [Thioploca ingrica]|uniref:Bacterial type II and III secretion system protein n=1 Tax=Thioploca ingrica TaxID=40754 RepID=A0A090AR44_9GAMM|nr:bacterial type II and III secretion system protein [Thioploca ingrica]